MPAESAFVDAIRETPDDRTLRLVYADWLDEAGDSRGELIRLQCELDARAVGRSPAERAAGLHPPLDSAVPIGMARAAPQTRARLAAGPV